MFTGIIQETGRILEAEKRQSGMQLKIGCPPEFLQQTKAGDSIAVNGACQTVETFTTLSGGHFTVFASEETLSRTNLGQLSGEGLVNLEHSLRMDSFLDGHLLSGHIDTRGRLAEIRKSGESMRLAVNVPEELLVFIAPQGSLAVDGISLTVNEVSAATITMTIIPHTYRNTALFHRRPGDTLNIEVDILARYAVNFLRQNNNESGRSLMALLNDNGFMQGAKDRYA